MPIQIEDGKGTGSVVEVKNNKLLTYSVNSEQKYYANQNNGDGYNIIFNDITPLSGSCFCYVKNTNQQKFLVIDGIFLHMDGDGYIDFKLNNLGTPLNGNYLTPVTLNTSSSNIAYGNFQYGNSINGLADGDSFLRYYYNSTYGTVYINFNMRVILSTGGVFTIWSGVNSYKTDLSLSFYYYGEK